MIRMVTYSDPNQPRRFAKGVQDNNKRMLDIDSIYDPSYLKGIIIIIIIIVIVMIIILIMIIIIIIIIIINHHHYNHHHHHNHHRHHHHRHRHYNHYHHHHHHHHHYNHHHHNYYHYHYYYYLIGKTVLITGGNRGIGLALTKEAVSKGANVIITSRSPSPLVENMGVKVIVGIDVTSNSAGDHLAAALNWKKIDILINNAGYFYEPVGIVFIITTTVIIIVIIIIIIIIIIRKT